MTTAKEMHDLDVQKHDAVYPKPGATFYAFWYTNSTGRLSHKMSDDRELLEFWRNGRISASEIFEYVPRKSKGAAK